MESIGQDYITTSIVCFLVYAFIVCSCIVANCMNYICGRMYIGNANIRVSSHFIACRIP